MDKATKFYEDHRKACNIAFAVLLVFLVGFGYGLRF